MGTKNENKDERARVVVLGGGIAGVEGVLALDHLAGDRIDLTLVSDRRELVMKPLTAEEPFSGTPADRYELEPLMRELGGRLVVGRASAVDPTRSVVDVEDGDPIPYDALLVCLGTRPEAPLEGITTLVPTQPAPLGELVAGALAHPSKKLSIVVPAGPAWPLPAYELALQTKHREKMLELSGLEVQLVTPEDAPLEVFGPAAGEAVSALLAARGIEVLTETTVKRSRHGDLVLKPGRGTLVAGAVIAMPRLAGPAMPGLPSDDDGFIPVDHFGAVEGLERVWAAGDGTARPAKQGGLSTQQADSAASAIAHAVGADVVPEPYRPVLRGQLLTGEESLYLLRDLGDEDDRGEASDDCLWTPPSKVVGRHLPAFLGYEGSPSSPHPPRRPDEDEFSLTHEWHGTPATPSVGSETGK